MVCRIPNTKYLFTGQEKDPESDLYNYNARLYNPTTGIFISADSVGGGNRYAYAANNPMRFTDPSGNNIWDEIKRLWDEISGGASFLDALTFSPSVWVPGLGERVNPIISQEMQESAARQYDPLFYINIGDERIAGPSMFHLQMATQFGMVQQYDAAKAGVGAADALWRDRNRALVRAPQGVDPEDMANVLVEEYGFTRIDIQEMIDDDFIYIPKTVEKAVISFDPSAVGARGSGNVNIDVQGAIRGWFQGQQGLGKDPRLLVISAGEIDPAIFTDPDMWWFNGPFDPGFWEIDMAGSTMRRYSPNIREGGWRLGKEIPF